MKTIFKIFFIALSSLLFSQEQYPEQIVKELPVIKMNKKVNIHFISPEPIQFMDLSSDRFVGDLPAPNIARVKLAEQPKMDSLSIDKPKPPFKYYQGENVGVLTIVGQSFMAQYSVMYASEDNEYTQTNITIQPDHMQPLEQPNMEFSAKELHTFSQNIVAKKTKTPIMSVKNLGLIMKLNNVYVADDYIFLDVAVENETNLSYNIDGIKFTIDDKKIYKATNNQTVDLNPVYQYNYSRQFKKSFRNIYVFKKFTFPNSKVLNIRLIENQISGRTIEMKVNYSDILNADTL